MTTNPKATADMPPRRRRTQSPDQVGPLTPAFTGTGDSLPIIAQFTTASRAAIDHASVDLTRNTA